MNDDSKKVRGLSALRAALVACVLGLGSGAMAQSTVNIESRSLLDITLTDGNANASAGEFTINIRDCRRLVADNPDMVFQWRLRSLNPVSPRFGIKLERPQRTCNRTSPAREPDDENCLVLTDDTSLSGQTVQQSISARTLLDLNAPDDCTTLDPGARDYRMIFVFTDPRFVEGLTTVTEFDFSPIRIILDNQRPQTPTVTGLSAGGSSVVVSIEPLDESNVTYRALYSTEPFDVTTPPETLTGVTRSPATASSSIRIESGIQADRTYYVAVIAIDRVGNESFASAPQTVTTVPTVDFWEAYRNAGGGETGGFCASGGPPGRVPVWMAPLALLALRRRREEVAR